MSMMYSRLIVVNNKEILQLLPPKNILISYLKEKLNFVDK